MKIILASNSPRRKELLQMVGLEFEVEVSSYEEKINEKLLPNEQVKEFAYGKAKDILNKHTEDVAVIGADTVVVIDGKIYGKPKSKEDAFDILNKLQGREHEVITGLAVLTKNKEICISDETIVTFKQLTPDEIWSYINTGEPMDKAGAYGVQGVGGLFIEKLEGSFYTPMGLPIHRLYDMLKEVGINIL